MKVHAIQTGVVRVHNRQRAGKGHGLGRFVNTLLDPTWTEWMPIYAWVIEHSEGVIVVDTGETARTAIPGYFPAGHPVPSIRAPAGRAPRTGDRSAAARTRHRATRCAMGRDDAHAHRPRWRARALSEERNPHLARRAARGARHDRQNARLSPASMAGVVRAARARVRARAARIVSGELFGDAHRRCARRAHLRTLGRARFRDRRGRKRNAAFSCRRHIRTRRRIWSPVCSTACAHWAAARLRRPSRSRESRSWRPCGVWCTCRRTTRSPRCASKSGARCLLRRLRRSKVERQIERRH